MSIFGRIWKAVTTPAQVLLHGIFRTIQWFGMTNRMKASELLKHYAHWVYICVSKNSQAVASIPLKLYVITNPGQKQYKYLRKGIDTRPVSKVVKKRLLADNMLSPRLSKAMEVEEVVSHPFLDLIRTANPWHNGFDTIELLGIFLDMTGDGYWYVYKDGMGIPQEIWVLPSQNVIIVPDKEKFIKGYLYGKSKYNSIALEVDEVVHFKYPNPNDPFYGFAPLQACIKAVDRKEGMDAYEESLLKNNARPDFIIQAKNRMNEPAKQSLREQWQQLFGTRRGRGKPVVLDSDAKIEKLGFSPKEMAFLKGQRVTMEEIAGAFGVPIPKLVPDAKYANAEVAERAWLRDTVRPRGKRIADKINEKLMPMYDTRLFVAFDECVPADRELALQEQAMYLDKGVLVINDIRAEIGKEPAPWGDVPLMPMTMMPLGTAPVQPSPAEEMEDEEEEEGDEEALSYWSDIRTHVAEG